MDNHPPAQDSDAQTLADRLVTARRRAQALPDGFSDSIVR